MNNELARRAKQYAAKHDRTFTQLVEDAVSRLISDPPKPRRRKKIVLPTFGDPSKKLTWEQFQAAVEETQLEDDLRSLGIKRHDPA
jgi:hypothetical protein